MNLLDRVQRAVAEIRRRRVFRAAAVYLAAAFVVLQLGDIVAEPLGLPHWTMALLIVLSAAGFVLTLALAWIYELTPDGVRRTTPAADAAAATVPDAHADADAAEGDAHAANARAVDGRGTDGRVVVIAFAALVLLMVGGWLARSALSRNAGSDDDAVAIAIVPFRVAGAGDELTYLREGMVDLLAALLSDRAALPVVPPRVLLRELGSGDGAHDVPSRAVLQRVGAARVITGEVVGRAEHLTLAATLRDVGSGREIRATASGPEHELEALVERLAAQLVARENPLTIERVASLDGVPLVALRHYLDGVALQRRGRFAESMVPLRRAVATDSTFALAALAFHIATGWAPALQEEAERMERLAWEHRHRLSERDQLHLEAQIWTYPEVTAPAVRLRRLERALESLPDRNELWYEYGDLVFHEGKAIGVNDWQERARAAFHRALELVPDDVESNYHLAELAFAAGDTAGVERVARLFEATGAATRHVGPVRGMLALLRDDSASWHAFRSLPRADLASSLAELQRSVPFFGTRGADSLLAIARHLERDAVTDVEAVSLHSTQFWLLVSTGRPTAALEAAARRVTANDATSRLEHLQLVAWMGFAWDADADEGRRAVEELRVALDRQAQRAGAPPPHPFHICTVALLDLLHGRTDWVPRTAAWLERGVTELRASFDRQQARSCPVIIAAAQAHATEPRAAALARLAELDAYLRESPFGAKRLRSAGNLVAAILHEHYGDPVAALHAWQRLQDHMAPNLLTTALREEARLLDDLGRRDEATAAYRHYLLLRSHAEPAPRDRDEAIRRRVAEAGPDAARSD